jgi:hypothetical protein
MRVVRTEGTEQARAHRVHLGLLDPVIQLQIGEAAEGGLDESLEMLQPRMPENHQSGVLPKGRGAFHPCFQQSMM